MSHSAPGRHRSPETDRSRHRSPLWAALAAVLVAAAIAAAIYLWPGTTSSPDSAVPAAPRPTLSSTSPSPSESTASVESTRFITVERDAITVEEVSAVVDGATARALPAELTPLGLELVDSSVVSADGRSKPFDAPVTIGANGSLTVRTTYRLTECPDVIPSLWPSPTDFPGASRTFIRLDDPLHTASAICPDNKSQAAQLPDLAGAAAQGATPRVRLTWSGSQTLTIKAIGSASGVAAVVPNPECDASCVASIPPGQSTEIQLAPVDPCPPATDSDRLTLVVQINGATSTIAIGVAGLSKAICSRRP